MTELLPCPFCGGEAAYEKESYDYYHGHDGYYYCTKCTCSRIETLEAWNTRYDRFTLTPEDEEPFHGS